MSAGYRQKLLARAEDSSKSRLLRGSGRRFHRRFGGAPVAGVARHVTLSIRELTVDLARHGQHHARRFLFGVIVTGEIALHVAEGALNAERGAERTHGHLELFGSVTGQNLQILRRSKRIRTLSSLFLGAEANGDKQQDYHKY
jgi:hypothetical protein